MDSKGFCSFMQYIAIQNSISYKYLVKKLSKNKLRISLAIIVENERVASEVIYPKIPLKSIDEVYVIDGKSIDGTPDFYKKKSIKVYQQRIKGLGGAMMEARKRCKTNAIIFFHPDGNENPKDIAKCAKLLREGWEFVIPSRMVKRGFNEEDNQLIKPRKWFNRVLAFFVNFLWKKEWPFTTEIVQGFRAIQTNTFDKLKLDKTDLTLDFQMVLRALKYNVRIYEFPTKEGQRIFGQTHFTSLSTGVKELRMLWREIFDSSTYPAKGL